MGILSDQTKYREAIAHFDKQIDRMHTDFDKYRRGETHRVPDWQRLERDLIFFSRRKASSLELSNQLDRVRGRPLPWNSQISLTGFSTNFRYAREYGCNGSSCSSAVRNFQPFERPFIADHPILFRYCL